jgi:hypothetical protein
MSSTGVAGSHQAAARVGDTVHVRTRATFDGVDYLELSSGPDADYCCCTPQSGSADMPPAPHRRTSQEV